MNSSSHFNAPPAPKSFGPSPKAMLGEQLAEIASEEIIARKDRQFLHALIDAIPDPIFVKDCGGRYLLINSAAKKMFHASDGVCIGKTVYDFPALKAMAMQYAADDMCVVKTGRAVVDREEPVTFSDGSAGWLLTNKYPMRDELGGIIGLVGMATDITLVKQANGELAETRRRLADHVENSPFAIVEWGPDMRVNRWAGRAEAIFEWKASEVVGLHFSEFQLVHIEDGERVGEISQRLLDGREHRNVSNNRNLTKTGRTIHCAWQNSVLYDATGRVVSILSLVQDVTERVLAEEANRRVEAERKALDRKLQESQKLESLGVLAGGIAHDFNNLLTGVLGNASLARMTLPSTSDVGPYLDEIEMAATRAADLCKQMLAYSGKGRFVVQRLDVNALIDETAKLLGASISKKAVLKFDLAPGLPTVVGDATQIRQVIMNLVINASEAIGDRSGFITVRSGLMRVDRAYLESMLLQPEEQQEDFLFIEVTDTGHGMSPDVQAKIFEPFYTTKFTGRGLGLAAVLGIVRGHKGALKVFSEEGWGTTFKVLLPFADGLADSLKVPQDNQPEWRGTGTVLIVDDEELVRVSTARMLEFSGFETVLAENGRVGVEKFRERADEFSLVLLDLTMPQMDGVEAFRAIRELNPEARVMLMSGYNELDAIARFTSKGLAGFIQKPFNLPTLRERLQEILS